ncbi:DUF2510 domain-containing protein [Pedococcus sp. NPDC057267]|uniref:DUF2510 domain-containing protein n=1 Tax=Pedococcus sp. NPDC057267 TaxID=3346077 RepID=UPI00363FA029
MRLFHKSQQQSYGTLPPAAWHPAPDRPGFLRWWDGHQWTEHYHPVAAADPGRPQRKPKTTYQTSRPAGAPVEPWAKASLNVQVVGESNYEASFRRLMERNRPPWGEYGCEMRGLHAATVPDPSNPYDHDAVAVWVQDELVGFLSRDDASLYAPPLADLSEQGSHLRVEARVSVFRPDDDELTLCGSVTLSMPPPDGVQSFNALPERPFQVLPHGGQIQLTGEEQHMDVLRRYVADRSRYLAVTLHAVPKAPDADERVIEVRLDDHRIGSLTKGMSDKIIDLVQYVQGRNRLPVCRAVMKGSPLRAEVVLQVAKSFEVTRRWLDSVEPAPASEG